MRLLACVLFLGLFLSALVSSEALAEGRDSHDHGSLKCSALLKKAGGDHARCLLDARARFQKKGQLDRFLDRSDACDRRFDRAFDRALERYPGADCTAVSQAELMDETDLYVDRYSNVTEGVVNGSLIRGGQCDVPSGLAWLGNPPAGVTASWDALKKAGFMGMAIDIGVGTAELEALSKAQDAPVIVLSISNSVADWQGFTLSSGWESKMDTYASAIALDTEKAAPSNCTWMNQQGFIDAFKHRNLLIVIDDRTCQDEFRALQQGGGWKIRFIGDAYSKGNLSAIQPCTDLVSTQVYPTSSIPASSIDPVYILDQCPQAAGGVFFDCNPTYPCESSDITSYMSMPKATAAMSEIEQRGCVDFGPPASGGACSAAFCAANPGGTCNPAPDCAYCNKNACHD
ncbi:MAG: hypothetical protein VX252_08960 [Myxococcota bacterium]|nr:hypothetical protein [Myxococcota bacterium]